MLVSRPRLALLVLALAATASADPVAVRFREGLSHGHLALYQGEKVVADGHFTQVPSGEAVTTRVELAFADGSVHDESATFTQDGVLRLVSYHLLQSGPSFPRPVEAAIERRGEGHEVRYRRLAKDEEWYTETMELPDDAYGGMIPIVLAALPDETREVRLHVLAFTPRPRLVRIRITRERDATFALPLGKFQAAHHVVTTELGPLKELFATIAGRDPEDVHVFMQRGEAPAFVRMEGALYAGGPSYVLERVAPRLVPE